MIFYMRNLAIGVAGLLLILTAAVFLASPASGKVVFLKGDEIAAAKEDGSDLKELTRDKLKKSQPHWSPDGSKISYWVAGSSAANPKTHATIVVITANGEPEHTIPVLSTE